MLALLPFILETNKQTIKQTNKIDLYFQISRSYQTKTLISDVYFFLS